MRKILCKIGFHEWWLDKVKYRYKDKRVIKGDILFYECKWCGKIEKKIRN